MGQLFKVLKVSGSDARSFLQGQLTQDVARLAHTPAALAAWCNAKGRVIAVMRMIVASGGDGIGLVVPAALAESLLQRLLRYKFRASVDFAIAGDEWGALALSREDDIAVLAALGLLPREGRNAAGHTRNLVAVDTGAVPRCIEVYGPVSAVQESGLISARRLTDVEWQLALIGAGIPLIRAATSEKYTPHMLNLDCLGAISFSKGCYTGQEVVARTQHLGSSKRRLMHFQTNSASAAVGDKLQLEGRDVGDVINVIGGQLLAVVPVELHGQTLQVHGTLASPVALPYAVGTGVASGGAS
ncbi:MAG: hypothetical protein WD795_01425 [Woeseia sp.]